MSHVARSCRLPASLALACLALTLGCGGGTDIAPSAPVVEGDGFAQATVAARDFGRTEQLSAGVQSVQNVVTTATDEVVSFGTNGFANLAHGSLSSLIVVLTGPGGAPVHVQGPTSACVSDVPPCDFWLEDVAAGVLQARTGGPIPAAPATLLADYSYNARLLTVTIGVTFPDGQYVTIQVFHLADGMPVPLTILPVVDSPPATPYPLAFNVVVQTNLTTSGSREVLQAFDDPANSLTVTRLDLTNEALPCVAGDLTVKLRVSGNPTEYDMDCSFEAPGC